MLSKNHAAMAALMLAFAIALGAFGAHALKDLVGPDRLQVFETAVRYQIYHCLAILLLFSIGRQLNHLDFKWVGRLFFIGIFLFSGPLYFIVIGDVLEINLSKLGMITPLGGMAFIVAWSLLAFLLLKKTP